MADHKTCINCQSSEFVATEFGLTRGRQIGITTGLVKKVTPSVYVCLDCGYCQLWVDTAEDLDEVRNFYKQFVESKEAVKV